MNGRRVRNNRKGYVLKIGLSLYIVLCLFATVWLKTEVVGLQYELGDLDRLRADLISERKFAVAQRANYYASERVEKVAVKRLGMTMPERENVFFVKRSRAAGPYKASMDQD